MRKLICVFLFLSYSFVGVYGQRGTHDVSLSFGLGSTNLHLKPISQLISTKLPLGNYKTNDKCTGVFTLGYKYNTSDRIGIGITFLYEHIGSDTFVNDSQTGTVKLMCKSIAAELEYRYLNGCNYSVYAIGGLGFTSHAQKTRLNGGHFYKDAGNYFNFQVSPLCLKVGRRAGLFAEAGFGYKGIINAGGYLRF